MAMLKEITVDLISSFVSSVDLRHQDKMPFDSSDGVDVVSEVPESGLVGDIDSLSFFNA